MTDVVEANVRAATTQSSVINIAGGSCVTVREVIALLEEISGTKIQAIFG